MLLVVVVVVVEAWLFVWVVVFPPCCDEVPHAEKIDINKNAEISLANIRFFMIPILSFICKLRSLYSIRLIY
ncbi:MAG: hypothetical protein FWC47_07160 [Oscillospiraceae bacterium]|nr:hypothetical protein [Oscillospiraceae bacterium]